MALNLSDLTGAATSGDILAEVQSTADFLDSVPLLKNLADPSGATDAKQFTATKQPKALPLTADSNGVVGGYCYLPATTGNAPAVTFPTIGANDDFVLEMDVYLVDADNFHIVSGTSTSKRIIVYNNGTQFQFNLNSSNIGTLTSPLNTGASTITCERTNGTFVIKQDGVTKGTITNATGNGDFSHLSFNGQFSTAVGFFNGYIKTATLSIEGTEQLNVDFTAPNVRHGDTKFTCATGQVVTINQSGNDPATIIKKPVLRFDGANSGLLGLLNQTVTDGYMFAAFSVLGDGGEVAGRILGLNSTGGVDSGAGGVAFRRDGTTNGLMIRYNQNNITTHNDFFDDERGDYLLDVKVSTGSQESKVNNADLVTGSVAGQLSSEEFSIGSYTLDAYNNAAIDLEYLALFPATLSDSQADQIRNYINNRNKVFYRWDTDGYYFFDGAATDDGQVFSGSGSWNGRIVGSDNGDSDFYANENTNSENRPTTDGYKVTFADNSDRLDIPQVTLAAGDSYAWMVCGTSLGTFSYKVTVNGETELNLLGHLGNASFRLAGDLYGIILLPENATNRDIEEARKLLIDRGASDGAVSNSYFAAWYYRHDITEFKAVDLSLATNLNSAWSNCSNLVSFPALDLSSATTLQYAFVNNYDLSSMGAIDARNSSSFYNAWKGCSSLTQFPQDAKLGTEATGVNFTEAWRESGLTSFSTPLPTATNLTQAWYNCDSLVSFSSELPEATSLSSAWSYCDLLSDFRTKDMKNCANFNSAWRTNPLTSFPQDALLGTEATSVSFSRSWQQTDLTSFSTPMPPNASNVNVAWYGCVSLTDFSADVFANWNPTSITNGIFSSAWLGCTSLTAQSVENILVPIANSGKWATTSGLEGGTALTDATIDIDYNASTGSLTAATLSAIETLNGRGWSVNINNEIIVPNILQLQPAAAYSLRSFDADADPTVVNVRRSSDSALRDFTASEVSDGTLRDWTLGDALALDGQKMYFDGIDDNIVISQGFNWHDSWDVSFKLIDQVAGSTRRFLGDVSNSAYSIYMGNSGLELRVSLGGYTVGTNTVTFGSKHYSTLTTVRITHDGSGTFSLYEDGVFVASQTMSTVNTLASTSVRINYNTSQRFVGLLYDLNINNSILWDGTITQASQIGTVIGSPALFSGQGFDGYVTTWYDQKIINETGDAYGTTISGTADGTSDTYLNLAPAVAGEYYRVRYTLSNLNPRGRVRFRNAADSAALTAVSGTASFTYITEDGSYETVVPSDDGLSLWFTADAGQSFDYSGISVQQVDNYQNNAVQTSTSAQPKIVENGVLVTENGEAAVSFDGAGDFVSFNHSDIYGQATLDSYYVTSTTDTQFIYPSVTSTTPFGFVAQQGGTGAIYNLYGSPILFSNGAQPTIVDRNDVWDATSGYKLVVHQGADTTYSGWVNNGMQFGNRVPSYQYTGKLQEMIFFNNDQSVQRTGIEKNINDHFNIYS